MGLCIEDTLKYPCVMSSGQTIAGMTDHKTSKGSGLGIGSLLGKPPASVEL